MATTISAFNDMMQQFLDELVLTFPDTKSFGKFHPSSSCSVKRLLVLP